MKKNFLKKLALAMALVVTATSVNVPAASAAAAPGFKSTKVTVNVGETKKYSTANSAKYSVKFKIGNTGVATIKYSSGSKSVKVTGVAAGNTTLRADFTSKATKKVTTKKVPVTVKALTLSITGEDNFTTAVNEKYTLTGKLSGSSSAKVSWSVAEEGATIDASGVFTATKAGEYNVTATAKVGDKEVATATQKITVKEVVLKSIEQKTSTTLAGVIVGDGSKLKASDIVITRTSDNVVFPVSSVTVDKQDAAKVTLTVFSKMVDGKEYTVKYGDTTLSFVATDGKPVSLVIDPVTVPFNTETEIHVLGKDAKGVTVFDSMMTNKDSKLDIDVKTTQGYMTGDKLVLLEKGNTAKVTAVLHTYEYNTDGTEKDVIKTEATVTAVDPEAVSLTGTKYTVAKNLDWSKAANTKVALGEDNFFLFFQLKNSKDKDVTADYTKVESSDTNTLLVAYSASGRVSLIPVKEGTAYVLVKDSKNNVVASFAVTVVAKREAAGIALSATSVNVSNYFADTATTDLTVKDQYGEKMAAPAAGSVAITKKSGPSIETNRVELATPAYANGKITVSTTNKTQKGTYVYEIKYLNKFVRMLTVNVQEANTSIASTYRVSLDTNKVDTTITSDYDGKDIAIKVAVGEYKGGVKVANTTVNKVDVFNAKGEAVTKAAINVNATGASIIVAKNDNKTVEKYLEAGSYSVKVTFKDGKGKDITATTGFVVEDSQPGVTYEVKKNSVNETTIESAVMNTENVKFFYNGQELKGDAIQFVSAKQSGKTYAGIKVKVMVPIGDYKVPVTVTLNQSITIK